MKPLILIPVLAAAAFAQEKTLDLTNPANYANQPVPAYITKDNTPVDNEITDLGATLGRVLFYDKRLSFNNTISCSSCHDQSNGFSASENAGKQLFLVPPNNGGAGCAGCHRPPEFDIDPNSGNNGVVTKIGGGTDLTNTRSPSLRDFVDASGTPHGGFMHDGSLPTLLSVINHYDAIPAAVPGIDPRLTRPGAPGNPPQPQRLNLTAQQKADLVSFLRTLTGSSIYVDDRYSNPFNEDGTIGLVVLPSEHEEMSFSEQDGTSYVTLRGSGVPNVGYLFQTSPDLDKWTSTALNASPEGVLEMTVPLTSGEGKMFYRFAYGADEE